MRHGRLWLASLSALLSGCLFWLGAQTPPEKTTPKPEAKEELTAEERNEATIIVRFMQVLEANPRRGTALDRIYGFHVERGSLQNLIDEFAGRTKKNEADGVAWMVVGLLESQRGKDANAVVAFKQAEKHLATNAMPGYYLGQSLILLGQPDAAAEAFERAILRKPGRTDLLDIFQALGRVYQRAQKADKALDVWNRVEKLFPDDPRVQDQIASTLVEEGQFEQALPRLEKLAAKTEDPYRKATLLMEAAELKVKLKQSPKALADLEKILGELNPDSWLYRDVRRRIEDVFVRSDDLAGLSKYYEAWIGKNPNDVEAIGRLARNLSTQGRLPEARTWLEKGIAVAPTRKELRQALIDQLSFEQKFVEAIPHYEAMDKNDPNNPDVLREWGKLIMRDAARPEAERRAAALAIWQRMLEKKAKDPVVTSQVADLVRSAGMTEQAIELYKKAIELAPNASQYREYLGEYYHSLKRPDEALATWRPIAAGANRNAKNLARLAEVFAGFGYRKEAIAALADAVALDKTDFNLFVAYADQLHQNEQHDEALKQLDSASKLISNAEDAETILLAQLKIYQATNSLAAHIDELQKELDDKKNPTADRWHRLARYYDANRQTAEATTAIRKAAELDPKSILILTSSARIHEASGNLLVAAETNRKLANLDRRFRTEYLINVAKLEAKLGRREQALQAGRDLLAAAPGNPDNHKFFAELCFQLGDPEEGLESLRRSVRANPSEPQGLLTLAQALYDRQRPGEAIELLWRAFEKTNELDGRIGIVTTLTEQYLQLNQFDRLLERLERERRDADKAREMTLCVAAAYQAAGDLGAARAQLERLLSENTRDVILLFQLSQLSESEGDINSALKYQRMLEKAAPDNPDSQFRLAQLLLRVGEISEAAEIWVKLAAGEPEPQRNLHAIDQLALAGKSDAVLAITARLLAQKPSDWELLYREGASLAQANRQADAAKRFGQILGLKLADDEPCAALKAKQKSKVKSNAVLTAGIQLGQFDPVEVPLLQRIEDSPDLLGLTGANPRYRNNSNQQGAWAPRDFGHARLAAIAWLYAFAQNDNKSDEFILRMRKAKEQAGGDSRARWDWYYLQILRADFKENFQSSIELAKLNDSAGRLAFLIAIGSRVVDQLGNFDPNQPDKDRTPPLPNDQLKLVLDSYRQLRQTKPDWLTNQIVQNVLTELRRAKRPEESELYREAVAGANTISQVQEALQLASARDDIPTALMLFEKLEKLQGPPKAIASPSQLPTRQAAQVFAAMMRERGQALARASGSVSPTREQGNSESPAGEPGTDVLRLLDTYLAHVRRQNAVLLKSASLKPASRRGNLAYGPNGQIIVEFPPANDYFDEGSIALLQTAYQSFKEADLLSDLVAHLEKSLAAAPAGEKVYHHLALGYAHWWSGENDEALEQLLLAARQVPNDPGMLLDVAELREKINEHQEALALLDRIEPLDHVIMQRREEAALRVAERTGNVARARQAAERLFGLRLDAEKQIELAGKMHHLGMHELAETVLGRAGRQAGSRGHALIALMHQYQSQGQSDMAVQIARQLLRKSPSLYGNPNNGQNENDNSRQQAIAVISQSGKLKELIDRAEAQLKSSPKSMQIYLTLLDYYRAAEDTQKVKETLLKMVELKPDDARFHYGMAGQLHQMNERAAAVEQYKIAFKLDPILFMDDVLGFSQIFQQAGKQEEFNKLFDQIDLRKLRNTGGLLQIIQQLVQNNNTRERGIQLFRKAWQAFPEDRPQLLNLIPDSELPNLPEIYTFARETVLPKGDTAGQPWRGADEMGSIIRLLRLARQQNLMEPLRKETAEFVKQRPEWQAGKALLAIIDLQLGKTAAARKAWIALLDDKKVPMPTAVRFRLAQEFENYSRFEDLYIRTIAEGIDEFLADMNLRLGANGGRFGIDGPVHKLASYYYKSGRKDEGRALVFKALKEDYRWAPGDGISLKVQLTLTAIQFFLSEQEPVEALRLCNDMQRNPEALNQADRHLGGNLRQSIENLRRQSIAALKTENLPASLRSLLEPSPQPSAQREVLDLVLQDDAQDLSGAAMTSLIVEALEAAAKKPETLADAVVRLDQLAAKYLNDFSVQIAAAVAALAQNKPERIDLALARLCKLMETTPLETLSGKKKANARQRAEAVKQIGLWFVAKACLKNDRLRPIGEQSAARAIAAAHRQLDPLQAQIMLREWGQADLDRGDRKAAESRWAELLEGVLPRPAKANGRSPVISEEQFGNALQIAKLAAENKMLDFSLKIVKESLRGGPPVSSATNERDVAIALYRQQLVMSRYGGRVVFAGQRDQSSVEGRLRALIAVWRKSNVPVKDIYQVLLSAVLPDARPAEIFSNGTLGGALEQAAIEAGQVDDLRQRVRSRLGQPLGELNARMMLLSLAMRSKNHAEGLQLIKEFGERLQQDTLQTTANSVAAALSPALKQPELCAAALPVLERAAKNLAGGNNDDQAQEILYPLAQSWFDRKDEAAARRIYAEIQKLGKRAAAREGGEQFRMQQAQRLTRIYLEHGWLPEALDQLGRYADAMSRLQHRTVSNEIILDEMPFLALALARQPAARRFELLREWTFADGGKALRLASGQLPAAIPPSAFGSFPIQPNSVASTGMILLAAAQETGKLDELAADLDKLDGQKITNAATLRLMAHLFHHEYGAQEPVLQERLKQVRERGNFTMVNDGQRQRVATPNADFLIAQMAAADSATTGVAEQILKALLNQAHRVHDDTYAAHVEQELVKIEARRAQLPDYRPTGPAKWVSDLPRTQWLVQDGVVEHLVGDRNAFLLFDRPLTGTFEFSVDAYQGNWAEGHAGYSGVVFEPNRDGVQSGAWSVGQHDRIFRQVPKIRTDAFNKLTIQVAPAKVSYLLNGELVYEDTEPAPTSPWPMLYAGAERSSLFRNFTLTGKPEVPKEVRLTKGNYLEGWLPLHFNSQLPARMAKKEPRQPNRPDLRMFNGDSFSYQAVQGTIYLSGSYSGATTIYSGLYSTTATIPANIDLDVQLLEQSEPVEPVVDWEAKDGEIVGRKLEAPQQDRAPSLLSYFRPLQPGETIRFEFFHKPGEHHVDPCLGRLAFLLEPDGVRLRWLVDEGPDWTGLAVDNAIDEPASRRGPKALPLKPGAFNTVALAVSRDDVLSIELNGTLVYERKLGPEIDRRFGLFHDRSRTAARVKNVVLTGNWPEKLTGLDEASFATTKAAGPAEAGMRRKLIGERGFTSSESQILDEVRSLPAAERYAKLAAWVLPNDLRATFNLQGTYVPLDGPNPNPTEPLPAGRRVLLGGRFESPVVELIAAAKQANLLDDLLRRVQPDKNEPNRLINRGRLALAAAIWATQEKDVEARAALQKLTTWAKALPVDAAIPRRWPDLIAAMHTMQRPALRTETLTLLDSMNQNVDQGSNQNKGFPNKQNWERIVRHARSELMVLMHGPAVRRPFGSDPGLTYWSPVAEVHDWTRAQGLQAPHWIVRDHALRHFPGHQEDFIYFNVPLRGDFEITCEPTAFAWREVRPVYGALRFDVARSRKEYEIITIGGESHKHKIDPPLPDPGNVYRLRLVVKDGTYTTFMNDRKLAEEYAGSTCDPWLFFECFHLNTGEVRNLKIIGSPTIPDSINLLALGFDMRGWHSYEERGQWQRWGDELFDPLAPREGRRPIQRQGRVQERTLFYHRPMLEDGEFEYEFFYEKGKTLVHPAFDRLAFMLEPDGVKLHWITDGPQDRSGIKVDNLTDEPANRRGGKLPLNDKSWNRVRMFLKGDTLTLHLNGQEIYQRAIESTNQRFFGFFHFADATDARIRQASYRGDWPKRIPKAEELYSRR